MLLKNMEKQGLAKKLKQGALALGIAGAGLISGGCETTGGIFSTTSYSPVYVPERPVIITQPARPIYIPTRPIVIREPVVVPMFGPYYRPFGHCGPKVTTKYRNIDCGPPRYNTPRPSYPHNFIPPKHRR